MVTNCESQYLVNKTELEEKSNWWLITENAQAILIHGLRRQLTVWIKKNTVSLLRKTIKSPI